MLGLLQHPNLDPVILNVAGPLALRWYGLMYVLAFVYGFFVFRWLQRIGYLRMKPEDVTNYIVVGVLGTFLGGRIGYLLFYQFDYLFMGIGAAGQDTSLGARLGSALKVWEGGMSFHGGVIGVALAVFIYAKLHKHNFLNIMDGSVHIVPAGVALVRVGNFINGELYGRAITDEAGKAITESDKLPWYAMKFPTDDQSPGYRMLVDAAQSDYLATRNVKALPADWHILPVKPELWERYQDYFYGRYPSQIIQFLFEGVLLLLIVWVARRWVKRPGVMCSLFLAGYAIFRIPAEMIRQPDKQIDPTKAGELTGTAAFLHSMGLTMGQLLSVLIFVWGAGMIVAFSGFKKPYTGEFYDPGVRRWPFMKAKSGVSSPESGVKIEEGDSRQASGES
ncbi:MAG: prolipoprotein diacylglyceryl transferase [Planctomycetes bacterium]|nr:prolipoprotein diacylglyceryl transferase [Planctomycetota bacterium]